jgi:hypothetical protein
MQQQMAAMQMAIKQRQDIEQVKQNRRNQAGIAAPNRQSP